MKISYFTRTHLSSLSGHQDASRYRGPGRACSMIHLVNIYSPFLSPKQPSEVVITRVLPSWGFYLNRSRRSPNLNTCKQSSVDHGVYWEEDAAHVWEEQALLKRGTISELGRATFQSAESGLNQQWKSPGPRVARLDRQGKNVYKNSFASVWVFTGTPGTQEPEPRSCTLEVGKGPHKSHYILNKGKKKITTV